LSTKPDSYGNKSCRIDLRALNEKTIRDAYFPPNRDLFTEILDQLGSVKYLSALDLVSEFHQILIHESNAQKIASSGSGHYHFNQMPLYNCIIEGATFQKLMDQVLSEL